MTEVPTTEDIKETGTGAVKNGAIAGAGYGLGSAVLGRSLGRPLGGVVAGAAIGGDEGDLVAMFGISEGIEAMLAGGGGSSQSSGRGRM